MRWVAWSLMILVAGARAAGAQSPLHQFAAVTLSPDGAHVADLESEPESGGGIGGNDLVIRDTATGAAVTVALPCGRVPECAPGVPAWAPDGKHLAFALRTPGGHARVVYRVGVDGGELTKLANFDGTVITLRYAPDGRLAALAIADADKEVGAYAAAAVPGGTSSATPREQRIALIDGGALHWMSPDNLFVYEYSFIPGGAGFVGTAAPGDGDAHWWRASLYEFDSPDTAPRALFAPTDRQFQMSEPRVAPDGKSVAFIGGLMSDFDNAGGDVFTLPLGADHAVPVDLTKDWQATATSVNWDCDGKKLIVGALADGGMSLVSIGGSAPVTLWADDISIGAADGAVSFRCGTKIMAALRESFTEPPEIVAGPLGKWHPITHSNDSMSTSYDVRKIPWTNEGMSGENWLVLPKAPAAAAGYPMVVAPHGGPAWSYAPSFLGPSFLRGLLDHGYALLLPNPRGGFGQGEAFTRANTRDFGGGDFRDIMAGVDAAIRAAPIDTERLGITGVSYGGFMTLWTVTRTHRFKAAVARAGISDWVSYYGENGIGDWLVPYFGASLYDDFPAYRRVSPIDFVKSTVTPTLMFVGAGDIECPPPQSQEFWHALDELSVPTGLTIYPGEGHSIEHPAHAADMLARSIAWFDRYLR